VLISLNNAGERMQDESDDGIVQEFTAIARGMSYAVDDKGRVVTAELAKPFVIDQLFERQIIDRDQHFYAIHFMAARKVFLRDAGTFRTNTFYDAPGETPPGPKYPIEDTDYLKMLRAMPLEKQRLIVMEACDDLADSGTTHRLAMIHPMVRDSFRALAVAVQMLWDKKEAEIEAQHKAADDDRKKMLARSREVCESYES
jgi:hypothetical protein